MLKFLRNSAGSWVVKGLLGLLILSFGVWGIGDVIRGGADQTAAITVGEVEVSPQYVRQQFDQRVEQLRQALGQEFTAEQARSMGFLEATVQDVLASSTLDMAARDLGITVSEDALRSALRDTRAFQTQDGQFSPDLFRRILQQNNLTEERYLALLHGDIVRQRLAVALGTGVAPAPLVEPLYAYRQERRLPEVLRIDASALEVTETPDEADLRDIYDASIARFTAPEYRAGVAVLLRQDDLLDRVEVSDQEIEDFYQANAARFSTPAKRDVSQVITNSQEVAAEVARLAQAGASLAEAATDAGASAPLDIGAVARDSLPADAAEPVFALDTGAVSDPIQSPLGWHVFQVNESLPGSEQPLAEVRDTIRTEIARERAVDVLYEESASLEDTLGGGATLEEAAQQLDLPLIDLPPVSIDGETRDGAAPQGLPEGDAGQTIVNVLFELERGLDSRLREIPGGYVVVRVDDVTPPAPRPFTEVEEQVRETWRGQKRQEQAEAMAKELAADAQGPQTLAALADGLPAVSVQEVPPLTRARARQGGTDLPASLVERLFSMQPGETAWAAAPGGAAVVRLSEVAAAQEGAETAARTQLSQSLRGQIGQDLMSQALTAYGNRFGVEINDAAIQRAF